MPSSADQISRGVEPVRVCLGGALAAVAGSPPTCRGRSGCRRSRVSSPVSLLMAGDTARQAREAQTQRAQVGQPIEHRGMVPVSSRLYCSWSERSGELSDALRQGATELVAAEVEAATRGAPATSLTRTPARSYGARAIPVVEATSPSRRGSCRGPLGRGCRSDRPLRSSAGSPARALVLPAG